MSYFFSNYYLEYRYCSVTTLNLNSEVSKEKERQRENIAFTSKEILEQIIISKKGYDI